MDGIPEEWQQYFKFTFVRNPYDRLISCWRMFTRGMENSKWQYPEDGNPELTLEQFLNIAMDDSIPFDGPTRDTFEIKLRHHALPQTHPFYCLDKADYVGRFENLNADFKIICDKLGLEGELPHWNRTSRDSYQQYFDDNTRRITEEFYAQDIEQLGYEF